jgi:MSHA pilin protein MshA
MKSQHGFTLIELIIVIVILGILAVTAAPRFIDISSDAKVAALQSIKGSMAGTIYLVQMKARANGFKPSATNPEGAGLIPTQPGVILDFGFGTSEVDSRNLCPEGMAESGDSLTFFDFMDLSVDEQMTTRVDNQYALIGYDVPTSGVPKDQGCYIIYNSFGSPNCTLEIVDIDC